MSSILVDQLGNPIVNRDVVGYNPYDPLQNPLSSNVSFAGQKKLIDAMGNEIPDYYAGKRAQASVDKITNPGFLNDKGEEKIQIFESMSGANTIVIFEIPMPDSKDGSVFITMKSIISISVSTSRAKMPIIPLGENTVNGFALGNKTVAGSIIKALTFNDEFTKKIQFFTEKSLKDRKNKFFYMLGSKTFFDSGTYEISRFYHER